MFQGRYQAHFNAVVNMDCFKLEKLVILFYNLEENKGEGKVSKRENCARNKKKRDVPGHAKVNIKDASLSAVFKRIRLYLRMFDCINKICTEKMNPSPTDAGRITLFWSIRDITKYLTL